MVQCPYTGLIAYQSSKVDRTGQGSVFYWSDCRSGPIPITMPLIVPRLLERLPGFSWFSVLIPVRLLTNLLRWTELAETQSFTCRTAGLVRFQ
jgi:hypothetical protein